MASGDAWLQGGKSIGEGIQSYMQLKRQDSLATGQIDAFLDAASKGGPQPPESAQPLIKKVLGHTANLTDKLALLGSFNTQRDIRTQDQAAAIGQQQQQLNAMNIAQAGQTNPLAVQGMQQGLQAGQQQQQEAALRIQAMQRQNSAMNNLMQMGQLNAGTGGGVPNPQTLNSYAQQQQGPAGNMTALMANYANATGMAPPPELLSRYMTMQAGVRQPIGVAYATTNLDDKTKTPTNDIWNRVYRKGDGSIEVDNQAIPVSFRGAPPGPVLDPNNGFRPAGQGYQPAGWTMNPNQAAQPSSEMATAKNDALAGQESLQAMDGAIQKVVVNAQAFMTANPSGWLHTGRFNPSLGDHFGNSLRSALWGDETGKSLEGAAGAVQGAILQQQKGQRITQKEFESLTSAVPHPSDPPATLQNKIAYLPVMNKWMLARSKDYLTNLNAGMRPAEAREAAAKANPLVLPDLSRKFPEKPAPPPAAAASPYVVGKIYRDSQGNKAVWTGADFQAAP